MAAHPLTMSAMPDAVELCEVGPRDGFQFEKKHIPTEMKLQAISELAAAGIPRIQVTSFVHPRKVPQMADAEDVVAGLPQSQATIYSGLVLNERGLERASAAGLRHVDLSIATNERHARDNAGMTVEEGALAAGRMLERAAALGLSAQIGFQTVFGYATPGDTSEDELCGLIGHFPPSLIESISLADSTGMANPLSIARTVAAVRRVAHGVPLVLHLHDTRGLGLANLAAALGAGVARFDTSIGGLGGCPFIPGATGNVATEDVAYLLQEMGIHTGIQLDRVAAVSREMAGYLGRSLPGKLYTLLSET